MAATLALMVALPSAAEPEITRPVLVQGTLRKADGSAHDGVFDFRVRLFPSSETEAPFLIEEFPGVRVKNGMFSLRVGTKTPELGGLLGSAPHPHVEIAVGGAVVVREPLGATAYALRAEAIPLAGSGSATTAARSDHVHDANTPSPRIVSTRCVPQVAPHKAGANAGVIACSTDLVVPWPALLRVTVTGHTLAMAANVPCTLGIDIDGDNPMQSAPPQALAPLLHSIYQSDTVAPPLMLRRQKIVQPGTHTISYWIFSGSPHECWLSWDVAQIAAFRLSW